MSTRTLAFADRAEGVESLAVAERERDAFELGHDYERTQVSRDYELHLDRPAGLEVRDWTKNCSAALAFATSRPHR